MKETKEFWIGETVKNCCNEMDLTEFHGCKSIYWSLIRGVGTGR
jgi:hypothetical protein